MGYKKTRLGKRILQAARDRLGYNDCHVFFGGTGAVGGTAVLELLSIYEEMFAINPPTRGEVPIILATARDREEIHLFTKRLFQYQQSRYGRDYLPTRVRNGYLTHSGVFVALQRFKVTPLPGLTRIQVTPPEERKVLVCDFLHSIGTSLGAPRGRTMDALKEAIEDARPFSSFLQEYRRELEVDRVIHRFRSVHVCIPLPSLMAYHLRDLELLAELVDDLEPDDVEDLKKRFVEAIRDDVAYVKDHLAHNVVVAHTTSVGGMYDEEVQPDGTVVRTIRLGFAHTAHDTRLIEKQKFAEILTELYSAKGINMLITAAAIGIDEVRVRSTVPVHRSIGQMLFDCPVEVFNGSKATQPPESRASREAGRPVPVRHVITIHRPITVPFDSPPSRPVKFERGKELRMPFVLRSGENGFFTVANAEALYRVMRVASASELGLVIAVCGLLGDDPNNPWFKNHVCYYGETDNSRQVLDFLAQPPLRAAQLSGLEPMALQDLGSAKHQCELQTLGLLILLHRLSTLDVDAIPQYVDVDSFDARDFFLSHSRPLTFEDVADWDMEKLVRDITILVSAESPEDLEWLTPFRGRLHEDLHPERQKARGKVLELALGAVFAVTSIGTPIIYEREGESHLRTGYFVAPLEMLVTHTDSVATRLWEGHKACSPPCSFQSFRDYHVCVGGFLDLRPHAILCTAKNEREGLDGKVHRFTDMASLRQAVQRLEPYSFFTMCGLLAIVYRLHTIHALLREATFELGTLQTFRWHMPRDENGHILVVPGIVEALRMVAEGLEKNTGTERLDGLFGYERRFLPDRRQELLVQK